MTSDCLTHSKSIPRACGNRLVNDSSRLLGHAKTAGTKGRIHILGSSTDNSDLKIVDHRRAVQCECIDEALSHQINQYRPETRLDDVSAEASDDPFLLLAGSSDQSRKIAKLGSREH